MAIFSHLYSRTNDDLSYSTDGITLFFLGGCERRSEGAALLGNVGLLEARLLIGALWGRSSYSIILMRLWPNPRPYIGPQGE